MNITDSTRLPVDVNMDAITKNKLFQKFVQKEEAKKSQPIEHMPSKPKIIAKKQVKQQIATLTPEEEEIQQSNQSFHRNFNPTFEPSNQEFIPAPRETVQSKIQSSTEREKWKQQSPDRLNESSIYHDFAQLTMKQSSPERLSKNTSKPQLEKLQNNYAQQLQPIQYSQQQVQYSQQQQSQYRTPQPQLQVQSDQTKLSVQEQLYEEKTKNQNLQTQNYSLQQQIDRSNQILSELRKKALDETHQFQHQILNQSDQISNYQEKIYQLQKSEDFLQMENDRLRQRMTQENLLRTKVDEEQKDLNLRNNETIEKLTQAEQQIQRLREELIHTRAAYDQYKGDSYLSKQQLQGLQERNQYLEQQLRSEVQRREMIQNQFLETQERIHRGQSDQETIRSDFLEQRRLFTEAQHEIESLRRQLQDRRNNSLEKTRQFSSLQSSNIQANQQIEYLKQQIIAMESQYMNQQRQISFTQQNEFYNPPQPQVFRNLVNENNLAKPSSNNVSLDVSYDKYSKYQEKMSKPTQAQQGGQNYFKEKDLNQEQNDKEIKEIEAQLMNAQLKKNELQAEIKKIEGSKVRTGANIRKKQELEQQLSQFEGQVTQYRTKLKNLNALFN